MSSENQENNTNNTTKEPTQQEVQKKLKEKIVHIFKQITNGCKRTTCYNIFCAKNPCAILSKI